MEAGWQAQLEISRDGIIVCGTDASSRLPPGSKKGSLVPDERTGWAHGQMYCGGSEASSLAGRLVVAAVMELGGQQCWGTGRREHSKVWCSGTAVALEAGPETHQRD